MPYYKFIARLSHHSFNFMKRLTDFLDALTSGFWLGVMGDKSLDYSDELYYNKTKYYTEEKYNESGLFEWEKPIIQKHFSNAKSILLIAAGGGREVLALTKMGFEVDSYECNSNLLEFGNRLLEKNGIDVKIRYLARNSVPDEIIKYDGIIVGWGAYSLIPGKVRRISFLKGLSNFLNTGSPLMISFIYTLKRSRRERIIKNVSNFFRFFLNKEKTELGDRLVPDFLHYFDEPEIKDELTRSGYKVIDYYSRDYGCVVVTL